MTSRYSLADVASLVGEPTRAAMLLALIDGRTLPATLLARAARLSPSATSLHLAKLTLGGLLAVRKEGRHRYYRLANAEVAHALEALGAIATSHTTRMPAANTPLRAARTCYDHLAGALSVALADMLVRTRVLEARDDRMYLVTKAGARWFSDALQIEVAELADQRRLFARQCLDWTERRSHVAGALGAALLERFVAQRWVAHVSQTRALRITTRGRKGFESLGLRAALDQLGGL